MVDQVNLLTIAHLAFPLQVTCSSAKCLVTSIPALPRWYFYPLTKIAIDEAARVRVLRDAARCLEFAQSWGRGDDGGRVLD